MRIAEGFRVLAHDADHLAPLRIGDLGQQIIDVGEHLGEKFGDIVFGIFAVLFGHAAQHSDPDIVDALGYGVGRLKAIQAQAHFRDVASGLGFPEGFEHSLLVVAYSGAGPEAGGGHDAAGLDEGFIGGVDIAQGCLELLEFALQLRSQRCVDVRIVRNGLDQFVYLPVHVDQA